MAALVLIPLCLFALIFPSEVSAQTPPQRVVITYSSRSIASIDLFIAQERGFFREEGLDPQLVQTRATVAIAAAEFTSLQNGLGVTDKNLKDQRDLVKRMLRARAKGNRYFHQNERGAAEVLVKFLNVDMPTALETYRVSRPAFTTDGIPTDDEVREYLKMDAQAIGLPAPAPAATVFDFSLQREVNKELGLK